MANGKPLIRSYYVPSEDYASSTLAFFYWSIYQQRNAEPFYCVDTQGFFQRLLKANPTLHYLKEIPPTGTRLDTVADTAPVVSLLSLTSLRRAASALLQYNPQTNAEIASVLTNYGLARETFDVGIVLDVEGCVPRVVEQLTMLQARLDKATLKVYVSTESIDLLREFAQKGHPSWSYLSLYREDAPTDAEFVFWRRLADLKLLQSQETLVLRLSSALGKLVYLTNPKLQLDSQVLSWDSSVWKPLV